MSSSLNPAPSTLSNDRFSARQTLEALRLGIVPARDIESLTIGLETEQVSLDRALARSRENGGDVQVVIGDYGYGKSHFIELTARRALRENFLVASASLDLVETPPTKPRDIYRALTTSLRYPDGIAEGLSPLFRRVLATPDLVSRFISTNPIPTLCPITAALRALIGYSDETTVDVVTAWLGAQTGPTTRLRSYVKNAPILYTVGDVARQYSYMLTALATLATLAGYSGLAILIDESEHYSLLRPAQRIRTESLFKALIFAAHGPTTSRVQASTIPTHPRADYPISFSDAPHVFFMFALTESDIKMPIDQWVAPSSIVRLDDRFIERDIRSFVSMLRKYHAVAFDYSLPLDQDDISSIVPSILSQALGQHRVNVREVIRLATHVCDLLYLYPESAEETVGQLRQGLGFIQS